MRSQIRPREKYLQTIINTTYIYPMIDIENGMKAASNTWQFTFDGNNIICPDLNNMKELYYQIWYQTYLKRNIIISTPNPGAIPDPIIENPGGYSMGVGTLLRDLGKEITFQLPNGQVVIRWRLVQQITPQSSLPPANVGLSYDGAIGYTTVFHTFGSGAGAAGFDEAYVVRVG